MIAGLFRRGIPQKLPPPAARPAGALAAPLIKTLKKGVFAT